MKGLLIKDWKLLKNQGRFFTMILICVLIPLLFSQSYANFLTSYLTFIFSVFVLSTLSYDSYDNGMIFLLSLPVSRKTYVQEKYVFSLILASGSWLFSVILRLLTFSLQLSWRESLEIVSLDPIYLVLVLLFLGYSLPLHLQFGSEKGRMISFGFAGLLAFGLFSVARMEKGRLLLRTLEYISTQSPGITISIVLIVGVVFLGISYFLSVRILERKEF